MLDDLIPTAEIDAGASLRQTALDDFAEQARLVAMAYLDGFLGDRNAAEELGAILQQSLGGIRSE